MMNKKSLKCTSNRGYDVIVHNVDKNDVDSLRNCMRRESKKYVSLAWLLSFSTTDLRNRKRKTIPHTHILLITDNGDDDILTEVIADIYGCISKRERRSEKKLRHSSVPIKNTSYYVGYLIDQGDHCYTDGNHNWSDF